jgi:hypothetical protein
LAIENRGAVLTNVSLPGELLGDARTVEAGYAPNVLPGVRLKPGFFARVGNNLEIYPSRWAFADYLALDAGGGHLSLYSVNSGPIDPVVLGFLRHPSPGRCSDPSFCVVHQFQTWITARERWTSPIVRIRVGQTAEQSILAYRRDNGIDAYPSVQAKLGTRLSTLAKAPLIKADLVKLKPFRNWSADLLRLPSPALLHPVAFQPGTRRERSRLPAAGPPLGDERRLHFHRRGGAFARSARNAVPERQLVGRRLADDAISPVAAPSQGHLGPRRRPRADG